MAVNFFRLVFKNLAIDVRYKKRIYMNKIGEREPYLSRIFSSLLSRASEFFRDMGKQGGRKRSFPSFPSHPGSPGGACSQAIWFDLLWIFAARELQQITLLIVSLLLNCFVNLAPLGFYFSLIFSLMPKTIPRETQLKLVQQTNMRNWRTCVWSKKSKWFVILEVPDYVARKKLRVKKERYLLTRERNDCNLGQKVLRILRFLTRRRPFLQIWYLHDHSPRPPPPPPVKVV